MKMKDLINYAIAGRRSGDVEALDAIIEFYQTWYNLMETPLEDLHLSRLDLEEQESDYLSIGGQKL